jgi:hypothetical protein
MEFSTVRENATQESAMLVRVLAVFGGMLAGAGAMMAWGLSWANSLCDAHGVVGPMTLGLVNSSQSTLAVLILAGGALGAVGGYWAWVGLAQVQCLIAPLPVPAALKRAAVPFVVFLPQVTYILQGRPACCWLFVFFLVMSAGFILLAAVERKDKRKIFFAFPTESDYSPSSLFTHGAVMVLGAGLGWYVQSLPRFAHSEILGLWFPILIGLGVWMAALGVSSLLGRLYTKHTFNQIFQAVALSALPLALLPLQSMSWAGYWQNNAIAGGFRLGAVPMILGMVSGAAMPVILVLALLKLTHRPVETQPAWEELFRALMLIAAIPLILISAAYVPAGTALGKNLLAGPLDFLREGETLASAQAVLMGRLPFKEILFRHGFLSDAVTGLAALGWFGNTAEGLRLLTAWLIPLGVLGIYYLGIFCLPWMWVLVLMVALLSGKLGMVAETRFLFTYAGFIFTFLYLQRERWVFLIGSGVVTVLAVIASFTAGIMAVAGHVVLLAAYALFGPAVSKRRWLGIVVYAAALLLGMLPWWLYLGMSGSLGDYFANFSWVVSHYQPVFGAALPAWGANPALATVLLFALPPVLMILGAWTVAVAIPKTKERGLPWNVLLLTVLIFLLWMRFIQRGHLEFLQEALPVCALLGAYFVFRWSLQSSWVRNAALGGIVLWAFIPSALSPALPELAGNFGTKNLVATEGLVKSKLPGLGNTYIPAEQAKSLEELAGFLDGQVGTTETFYDFSNQPLLYFLVQRRPVVPALLTASLATFQQQLDAVQNIADARVKTVVWGAGVENQIGSIPSELRQYAVSEYLLSQFVPMAVKGGSVLLGPRAETLSPDTAAAAALQRPLQLGQLAYFWGRQSKYGISQGAGAGTVSPADGVKSVEPVGVTVTGQGEQVIVAPARGEMTLRLASKPDSGKRPNVLVLQLKAAQELDGQTAVLAWGDKAAGRWLSFTLKGGGASHPYVFRMNAIPAWVLAGDIAAMQLEMPQGGWTWEKGQWLAIKDIPQIKAPVIAPIPDKAKPVAKKK